MMNIELMIEGKKKTFKIPSFIPGRMVRQAISFTKNDLKNIDEAALDEMVEYVVNVFGQKFTMDEFYDGINSLDMMDAIGNTIQYVVNGTVSAAGGSKDPNK